MQNSNDLIAVLDAEGTMRSLIGPVQSILGYEPSDLIGQNGFGLIHPDDVPRTRQVFAAAAAEPGSTQRAEYRFPHKRDGHWVWMEVVGTNWLHDPGIAGFVLNIREITERKNAEEERVKLQEQLQQAMKMETVGRLAGGVAHDFNNLLTVIAGNVELARADLSPEDPLAQQLAEIARAAESAATLTRQLLAFSRRQVIEPKVLDLNELIGNLRKMLQRLIGEDIALELTQGAELGAVKVDPGQFEQVVVNLSVNARDAMPEGGRLIITTSNVELDATYCQQHQEATPGNYVMLAVSDTGHGMPPHAPVHSHWPAAVHVSSAPHVPHEPVVRPHPSSQSPHCFPRPAHDFGMQHAFWWQRSFESGHVPHTSVPPHPSSTLPQAAPSTLHVAGRQHVPAAHRPAPPWHVAPSASAPSGVHLCVAPSHVRALQSPIRAASQF